MSSLVTANLRHGIFLAPFHQVHENPTLCLERDFELVSLLDKLGFDEAWIGEHHSAGFETISSPELFIAAAAERTRHIRLGTGVISLPYHNPLMVANRMVQLDHMTRGRVMYGVGPGLLASDALMLGIDPMLQRDRMAQAIAVILRLLNGEIVTETTDWYSLHEARLHLLPFTRPYPEMAVASAVTPSGGRLAGKHDLGMLCVAAGERAGFDALDVNWKIACEIAAENGRTMDTDRLRLVLPMHLADTREQAIADVRYGLKPFIDYFNNNQPRFFPPEGADTVDWYLDEKIAVVGTPEDAIERIEALQEKQGDFGAILLQAHNWADWERTKHSYELYARYVIPHFNHANKARDDSYEWVTAHTQQLSELRKDAAQKMFEQHEAERGAIARAGASQILS